MMRMAIALCLALPLAACEPAANRAAKDAERRFAIVKASGTLDESCKAAEAVRDAWLAAIDRDKYRWWQVQASLACNGARIHGGYLPADEAARAKIEDEAGAIDNAALDAIANSVANDSDAGNNATDTPDDI